MKEKRKGFYLAGEFSKGRKAGFIFLTQREKPFEIDNVEGTITGKAITIFDRKRNYMFPDEWFFFDNHTIADLNTNKELQEFVNDVWEEWCKTHQRKYYPLFDKAPEITSASPTSKEGMELWEFSLIHSTK